MTTGSGDSREGVEGRLGRTGDPAVPAGWWDQLICQLRVLWFPGAPGSRTWFRRQIKLTSRRHGLEGNL